MPSLIFAFCFVYQNEQRQRRKDEAASGVQWQNKLFAHVASDPTYRALAKTVKGIPDDEDAYVYKGNA